MPPAEDGSISSVAGRIADHHHAYRQGLVLGLTMAEVAILIVFVLLLLIAFESLKYEKEKEAREGLETVPAEELAQLVESREVLESVAEALGIDAQQPPDDFLRLVDAIQPILSSASGEKALEQLQQLVRDRAAATERFKDELAQLDVSDSAAIADKLDAQADLLANKEGQLVHLERQIARLGGAGDNRPCWVRPDGRIEYLFDVVLVSDGVRMRQYSEEHRLGELARLPMPPVDATEVISPAEFLSRTRPLYERSVKDNCRFFVRIYDGLPDHEKRRYQSLRETVERHFYINAFGQHGPIPE